MDRFDRIYSLHRILSGRRVPVSRRQLEEEMDVSRATVKRTLEDMRNTFDAPIVYDPSRNGYLYTGELAQAFELPGFWLNSDELFALLTTHMLLSGIQPGLLDDYVSPFLAKIEKVLPKLLRDSPEVDWRQIRERVRILQQGARSVDVDQFRRVVAALVRRQRLKILYHGRERDKTTERVVSPQRLVYYRDNWYLDAWCHLRDGLRSFSLDRLHPVCVQDDDCRELSGEALDSHFAAAYGIFSGQPDKTAHLMFSAVAAKWVADEHWHPDQRLNVLADGRCELFIPYGDPRELVRDILKHGAEVEVLSPESLRAQVAEELTRAARRYR